MWCYQKPRANLFSTVCRIFHYTTVYHSQPTTFSQQDTKRPTDIFQAAVSQFLHLAKTCSEKKQARKAYTRGPKRRWRSGSAHTARPKCAASWAWHSEQECFQTVKRNRKKEGGKKRREGGRRRGGMRAKGICASLWETLLVLIYTSMTTAQNELTVRGEQQQPKARNKKETTDKVTDGRMESDRWLLYSWTSADQYRNWKRNEPHGTEQSIDKQGWAGQQHWEDGARRDVAKASLWRTADGDD